MQLTVNIKKSKYMIVCSPNTLHRIRYESFVSLTIKDIQLNKVKSYEYFGVLIDDRLSMEKTIGTTYKKAANKLYLFGIIRKYLNKQLASNIFKAMAMPYLEYTFFLFSSVTDKSATKLQIL